METCSVYNDGDIALALSKIASTLQTTLTKIDTFSLTNKSANTKLQTLFNLQFKDDLQRSLYEIVVSHALKAEKMSPGGFEQCITVLIKKITSALKGYPSLRSQNIIRGILGAGTTIVDSKLVVELLHDHIGSSLARDLVMEATLLGGFRGKIIVERTDSQSSIELVVGNLFEQEAIWPLNVKLQQPRVFCIDGFIESVSEIHHLLQCASDSREQVVIFARGASEDVKHTLKVNYDRGTLKVILVIVKFDLDGINTMNDIAIVCGCDLVSSNKGDLISTIKYEEAPLVFEVMIQTKKTVIINPSTQLRVNQQLNFLKKKRDEQDTDDLKAIFNQRIKTLESKYVLMRLSRSSYDTLAQDVDCALRVIRSAIDHGVVEINNKKHLAATIVAAEVYSDRCLSLVMDLGGLVKTS